MMNKFLKFESKYDQGSICEMGVEKLFPKLIELAEYETGYSAE